MKAGASSASARAQQVLQHLHTTPGATSHELAAATGASYQVVCYTLRRLADYGLVSSTGMRRVGNLGAQPAQFSITEAGRLARDDGGDACFIRRKHDPRPEFTRQAILDTLRQRGPLTRRELVAKSGVGLSTLVSYVPSLKADGLVSCRRRGREVVFHTTGV